jgi:carboxypeptidase D
MTIRTNGGPGCSSLEGFLQENGVRVNSRVAHRYTYSPARYVKPFQWSYGQAIPTQNEFSWTNLSSVLWVEQPVGTGFSQGTPNIQVLPYFVCCGGWH